MGFISKWLTKNKVTVSPDSGFPIIITRLPRRSSSDLHRRISSSNSPTTMNPAFFPSPALESGPYPTPSISHDEEYNIFHPQIQYHPQSGVPYPMKASIYALPPLPSALPIPIVAINDENMPPVKVAQLTDEREESIQALALPPDTCPRSTVNILVESDGKCQSFTLHRDLLCYYSPYFRDLLASLDDKDVQTEKKAMIQAHMLHREWRWGDAADVVKNMEVEGPGNADGKVEVTVKVKLPETVRDVRLDTAKVGDVTRMVFAAFVEWLYQGFDGFGLDSYSQRQIDATTLIHLWVFAGKIGVPGCQNACIEAIEMWRQNSNIIQTAALAWLYENTKEYKRGECKLKKLLVDQCVWKLDGGWIESAEVDGEEAFPKLALLDLVAQMRRVLNSGANIMREQPPFTRAESRKKLYWVEFEEKWV